MTILLLSGIAVWSLWVLYVLVMGLYRAKLAGRLSKTAYVLGWPFFALGLIVDIIVNMTVACVLFLEPPRETLVTSRLQRHIKHGRGWRFGLASWICSHLLDPFDPTGSHCD